MCWFRSKMQFGSRLALAALALQIVLTFGHVHSFLPTAVDTALSSAVAASDGSSPRDPCRNGLADFDCPICALINLAGTSTLSSPRPARRLQSEAGALRHWCRQGNPRTCRAGKRQTSFVRARLFQIHLNSCHMLVDPRSATKGPDRSPHTGEETDAGSERPRPWSFRAKGLTYLVVAVVIVAAAYHLFGAPSGHPVSSEPVAGKVQPLLRTGEGIKVPERSPLRGRRSRSANK